MTITVVLYAGLARFLPAGAQERKATVAVPDGATVRDVLLWLGIPDEIPCIPVIDGGRVTAERIVRDRETLSLFPPLAGGTAACGVAPSLR